MFKELYVCVYLWKNGWITEKGRVQFKLNSDDISRMSKMSKTIQNLAFLLIKKEKFNILDQPRFIKGWIRYGTLQTEGNLQLRLQSLESTSVSDMERICLGIRMLVFYIMEKLLCLAAILSEQI